MACNLTGPDKSGIQINEIWETNFDELGFASNNPPGHSEGIVYSCVGSRGIKAFRSANGELIWQTEHDPTLAGINKSRFVFDTDRVYANIEGYLHCFNKYNGEPLFSIRNGCSRGAAVDELAIYVEDDLSLPHRVVAANKTTGEIIWATELLGRMWEPPKVDGQFIYISMMRLISAEIHGHLYKVDKLSGDIIFEVPVHLPEDDSPNEGPTETPVIFGDNVIIENSDLHIYAYDTSTGDIVWTYDHGGAIRYALKEEGGILYFATQDSWMVALSAQTGEVVWKNSHMLGSCTAGPAAIAGDYLFVTSADDYMYCFHKGTGEFMFRKHQLWSPVIYQDTLFVGGWHETANQFISAYKIINK